MFHRVIRWPALWILLSVLPAATAAQGFGQNKVQYKNLDWSIIDTEHFEVYFYEGEREAAVDAARMAERAYERLSAMLQYKIDSKVPLILYASHTDFQSSNVSYDILPEGTGGFTEYLKRRVVIPFTGGYGDLDHVLTHELVHAFQVDLLFGKADAGLANPFGVYVPPLWFMEGMAEYLSVTEVDHLTEMWLRDAALQGYLIPLDVLSRVGDIRNYRFGQSIFAYIGRVYGDGRIGDLLKRAAHTRDTERAFQDVLGITLEKFSQDWMEDVRKTYLPQIADHKKPEDFARRLTNAEKGLSSFHLAPSISPGGDQMVYLSDPSLYIDLYLASALDGKTLKRLAKGDRREEFESLRFLSASMDWSPDGERLVFAAKAGGEDAIYIMRVRDAKVIRRIKFGLDGITHPTFSPDGEWIVFAGLDGGRSDLYRCRANGRDFERLTDDRYLASAPHFSPDGRQIVFVTDHGEETDFEELIFADPKIALLDLETREVRVLTNTPGTNSAPHFFPDGRHLLYISDRSGITNLFVRDLETGEDAQITDILTGITGIIPLAPAMSLSRDGRRAVFSAFGKGTWDLFAIKDPLSLARFGSSADSAALAGMPEGAGPGGGAFEDGPAPVELELPDSLQAAGEDTVDVIATAPDASTPLVPLESAALDSLGFPLEGEAPPPPPARDVPPAGVSVPPSPDKPEPPRRIGEVFALHRALPDTSTFKIGPYRTRFSVDFASAGGFFASNVGVAAQTVLVFSDVLGNHNIVVGASVYGSISDSDLLFQYANLSHRTNYGISLFQLRDDFFLTTAEDRDEFVSQIYRGVDVTLSRPFSRFRRLELVLEGLQVSEKVYREVFQDSDLFEADPTEENNLYFARPGLALVRDNTLYGVTGPISGERSRYSADISFGDVQSSRFIFDRRNYWNIRQRTAFAVRLIGATSQGRDPLLFRIGGPWTIRGYDFGEFDGHHVGIVNIEFRFPLIETLQLGWPLPLGLRGIRGAIFFDAGSAWDRHREFRAFRSDGGGFRLDDIHASYGLGAAINVGFAILRWELAQPTNLRDNIRKVHGVFSIGSDF